MGGNPGTVAGLCWCAVFERTLLSLGQNLAWKVAVFLLPSSVLLFLGRLTARCIFVRTVIKFEDVIYIFDGFCFGLVFNPFIQGSLLRTGREYHWIFLLMCLCVHYKARKHTKWNAMRRMWDTGFYEFTKANNFFWQKILLKAILLWHFLDALKRLFFSSSKYEQI